MWTSVSGAVAQSQKVDMISNNLANSDTLGFKKDIPSFKEYLGSAEREMQPKDIIRGPIKDKEFFPLDAKDQAHVILDGTHINFKQGNLRVTQSPLDVALDGPGFLEVSTPDGIRYTRSGSLKIAPDGNLVTVSGHAVLATSPGGIAAERGLAQEASAQSGGPDPSALARVINLRDVESLQINQDGEIYAGNDLISRLSIVEFQDVKGLRKAGGHLFENKKPGNFSPGSSNKTLVRQGLLELSNVNPIEEMTQLIQANRLFEQDLKALKTYGELMGREANDIGKVQ